MSGYKKSKRNKRNKRISNFIIICIAICCVMACVSVVSLVKISENPYSNVQVSDSDTSDTTTDPSEPVKVSSATIGSAGDVLIHVPIFNAAYSSATGTYDFSDIFTKVSKEIKKCDYFVANLETTLAGTENGRKYTGYPRFNSPDSITTALKNAGVDCLLTANNHCYDTNQTGVLRTQQIVKQAGFDYIGTRTSSSDKKYMVKQINDIKFGMTCYTYETQTQQSEKKALNGIAVDDDTAVLINSFDYTKLTQFYSDLETQIASMKQAGAEIIIVYLHWGNEYQLEQNDYQKKIAQQLCDMGVDVIVGGHPHVVQPIDLITSTDGSHSAVCVYSMGNFVSNQRRSYMGLKTGHTEDGLIFKMFFSKYSDGTVVFEKIRVIPTWVNLYKTSSKAVYSIVPLSSELDSKASTLGLTNTSDALALAKGSYERTQKLVSDGVKKCNRYLYSLPKPGEEPLTTQPDLNSSGETLTQAA